MKCNPTVHVAGLHEKAAVTFVRRPVASPALRHMQLPSTCNNFIFSSL